jgi:transcriptional regulator with XRE-family HTH domain
VTEVDVRDPAEQSLARIGEQLQALRRGQGLTLEQLAADSGLSTGYLSQIENGQAVPSLTALGVIAAELGVDVAHFFPEPRRRGTRLVRADERHAFRVEQDRAFTALYARHLPGAEGNELPFRHLGEEFCLVFTGTLRITVDGESHDLGPGDWIHYSSHPSHGGVVVGDEPVDALWILTPAVI